MNNSGLAKRLIFISLIFSILSGCSSLKYKGLEKKITRDLALKGFQEHFTGLLVIDPVAADTLLKLNHDKYFTPASNTKIFTLYTALKILGDSLPALRYSIVGDTVFFSGTGNPVTLHPYFRDSSVVRFLAGFDYLSYVPGKYVEGRFGPGWAWEDYDRSYSAERSSFPLYGNVITVYNAEGIQVEPYYFRDSVKLVSKSNRRKEGQNTFYFNPGRRDSLEIPFITSDFITAKLMERILGKPIRLSSEFPEGKRNLIFGSTPADSVYKRLMQDSDNFLAEQLMMLSSSALTDTLSISLARDFVLDTYLSGIRERPRWVDGSGLSRYNLFSPGSMVFVLVKLLKEAGKERLFSIFPAGGKNGTLEEWYQGDRQPYVFAKSGTLGNTYCLSGYLIGKSGKLLVFSFMNNHFVQPTSQLKARMQEILETIRDAN